MANWNEYTMKDKTVAQLIEAEAKDALCHMIDTYRIMQNHRERFFATGEKICSV